MKKVIILVATALLSAVTISCHKDKVTDVRLNKTELTLLIGDTANLIATVLPENAENKAVSWKSNNPATATVDNHGKVTAIDTGTAIITVITEDGEKTATCKVTVTAEPPEPIEEPEMVFIEGGTFMYGLTQEEFEEWEEMTGWKEGDELDWCLHYPQEQKTVGSFYIAKYPVTQKLWKQVMGTLPQYIINDQMGDDYPIYYVSALDVAEFIEKLNLTTGKNYHTPSSVEWEYAAKGGNKSQRYKYSGSNNLDEVAWNERDKKHPVGEKLPNELGIFDMTGNVEEWICGYGWGKGPTLKTNVAETRGGSWFLSFASWQIVHYRTYNTGLRLALSISG